MNRRKFIAYTSGAAGLVLAGGYIFVPSFLKVIEDVIAEDLKGLKFRKTDVKKFIIDARDEQFWKQFTIPKQLFFMAHCFLKDIFTLPYYEKYLVYRSNIVGQFLLSTDHFLNKMDPDKEIKYVAFYNPYKRPCGNPFSSLYYN